MTVARFSRQAWLPVESVIAWWLLTVGLAGPACAHPFHISTAEVEYDAQSDRLQVCLKLQAIDLEQALARLAGKRIDIEQAETSEQIMELLGRSFFVTTEILATGQALEPAAQRDPVQLGKSSAEGTASQTLETKELQRSKVHWVGQELKGAWLWLYFELELPQRREGLRLFNTVLFETNDSQINTVSVRHGNQRTTLKLTPKQPSANFERQWLKPQVGSPLLK